MARVYVCIDEFLFEDVANAAMKAGLTVRTSHPSIGVLTATAPVEKLGKIQAIDGVYAIEHETRQTRSSHYGDIQ